MKTITFNTLQQKVNSSGYRGKEPACFFYLYPKNMEQVSAEIWRKIKEELILLDKNMVEVDGQQLKPSQCYYWNINPTHVLFNTNCPQSLREKVELIVSKHTGVV